MIVALIFIVILPIIGILLIAYAASVDEGAAGLSVTGSVILIISLCYIIDLTKENKPAAIDVYRGKTTLEITYRDSVAVDSVVVFKTEKK